MNTFQPRGVLRPEAVLKDQVSLLSSAFQRNCAKLTSRYSGEYKEQKPQQANVALNVTVQGKTWESGNLPSIDSTHIPQHTYKDTGSVLERWSCKEEKKLNKEKVLNMTKNEAAREEKVGINLRRTTLELGAAGKTEHLSHMVCSGQRMSFAESISSSSLNNYKDEYSIDGDDLEKRLSSNGTIDRQSPKSHSVVLNKLYSSLKKMKSRRKELKLSDNSSYPATADAGGAQSLISPILNRSFPNREEYVLLGGRSKPIRFNMNAVDLNLLEQEFGLQLKARSYSNGDEVDLILIQQFKEKYKTAGKPKGRENMKSSCNVEIPWARHIIVRKKTKKDCQSSLDLDSGKRLSIHVYLPNLVPQMPQTENPEPKSTDDTNTTIQK